MLAALAVFSACVVQPDEGAPEDAVWCDTAPEPVPAKSTWVARTTVLDRDGDGLSNADEAALGCTDPANPDSDDDGLPDGLEAQGPLIPFPFWLYGDPCRRDLYIEVDYQERVNALGVLESARLSDAVVDALIEFYAALPIANPDGSLGIDLHLFHSDILSSTFECDVDDSPFTYDPDYFRKGELCLQTTPPKISAGAIGGQRFRIHAQPVNATTADDLTEARQYTWYQVFLHEIGHNLGLGHGGDGGANYKPNYPSLMNYMYSKSQNGSPRTLQDAGIQFSSGALAAYPLDECAVEERHSFDGVPVGGVSFLNDDDANFATLWFLGVPGPWVDWDRDGGFEAGTITADLDGDGVITCGAMYDVDDHAIIATDMDDGLPGDP